MKKKRLPKYQIAGANPRATLDDIAKTDPYPQGFTLDKNYLAPRTLPENAKPLDLQEVKRNTIMTSDVSPTFQALNAIALGTGAVANTINEYKTRADERRKYINSLQQPYDIQNPVQNDAPLYTKYGGKLCMYPFGGGPLTAEGAKEMLRDGTAHGKKLTDKQKRYFGYIAGGGKPEAKYGVDLPETKGLPTRKGATIEAEGGEVYQQPDGNIIKIDDNSPSHEQGGVPINNVERVLEDTSTTRKDVDSKALKLTPTDINSMFGVKPNRSLSHSETLEFVNDKLQKKQKKSFNKFNQTLETLDQNPNDKYASNSLDMNSEYISNLPNKEDVFDTLFDNQETIKNDMNIQNGKAKYGKYITKAIYGIDDPITLKNPDKGGGRTPTGRNNNDFHFTAAELEHMAKQFGLRYDTNKNFQSDLYDAVLKLPNGKQIIDTMWSGDANMKGFGNTNQGIKTKQVMNKQAFVDGDPKARTMFLAGKLAEATPNGLPDIKIPRLNLPPEDLTLTPPVDNNANPNVDNPVQTNAPEPFNLKPTVPSKFNEPLHWYDTAAETLGLLENERTPTVLNPVQLHHVTPKLLNPLPALQAGQRDFNAVTDKLPSTGAGMSNATNAFAQKYSIDNQILGQYENNNNQIENQARYYNAGVDDKQSEVDAQSREQFERKQLGSMEAQRQQKLTLLDSIFTKIAQNHALNRNGNLIQQLAPQYDQYGVKNDNKYTFSTGATPSTGNALQFIYDQSGRKFRVMTDAKGKQVIVPDTKIAK